MSALPAQNVIPLETEPQPVPSKATLYAKLARVMGKVTRIERAGTNKHFTYRYVTDADVADAVRGALAEEKVAFLVNMLEVRREGNKVNVTFEFTFACGDTGATITKIWEGESIDQQDKGISKAATNAEKYFLMKTFLMSSDDPAEDADSGPVPEQAKPAKPKQERRIDTSKDAPPLAEDKPLEPSNNGKDEGLFQYLMKAVKHPRYQDGKARANAINKLMLADLLPDGERAALVKRVEHYATLRDDGKDENAAMLEIRKELQRPPAAG